MEKNGENHSPKFQEGTAELYVMLAGIHWKNTEAIVNGKNINKSDCERRSVFHGRLSGVGRGYLGED